MKAPRYDTEGLASVLPSVARTLAPAAFEGEGRKLPQARAAIVVLADLKGATTHLGRDLAGFDEVLALAAD